MLDTTSPQSERDRPSEHLTLTFTLSRLAVLLWKMTTDEARQLMNRYVVHVTVLALAIVALTLGGLPIPRSGALASPAEVSLPSADELALNTVVPFVSRPDERRSDSMAVGGPIVRSKFNLTSDVEVIHRQAQPLTEVPHRLRTGVFTYTVQPGDTTQGIALAFGLEDTTIMWSNPAIEDMPDYLKIGQEVVILPIDGVYHSVKDGDTLASIAEKYKVDVSAITDVSYNNLQGPDYGIEPGMQLIVAGGEKPYIPKIVTAYNGPVPEGARGTGLFQWPATGNITQGYWWGHRAIDIAAYNGAQIYAADGGFVSFAGWTDIGYGYLIIIDHANGFATYYAHMSGFYVSVGEKVERGDMIGLMGSTGNSTGPHLHFEIRSGAALLNPRAYLP